MTIGRRDLLFLLPGLAAAATALSRRLGEAVDKIPAFNTHEHILPESERTSKPIDFFDLASHYAISDLVSAGLPREQQARMRDHSIPALERWAVFEPYWKLARHTGYCQALRIAMSDIYGCAEIGGSTLAALNEAIARRNKMGLYRQVLKERARIAVSVLDDYWNAGALRPDPEFFLLAHKFDRFVTLDRGTQVAGLEKLAGESITTLAGLEKALGKTFQACVDAGMVTVKTTLAYQRELHFRSVERADAEREFEAMMRSTGGPAGYRAMTERPFRNLEDYMFHRVLGLAVDHKVPVQVHTGIQAGSGNVLTNSKPSHLTNLFFAFPTLRFDLFHAGYPYQEEAGALAKMFPNVFVDMCWTYIISPQMGARTLRGFLDLLPYNKVFGYGGDYQFPELSYGHLVIARRVITAVLAEMVEEKIFTEETALTVAKAVLYDNAASFFTPKRA